MLHFDSSKMIHFSSRFFSLIFVVWIFFGLTNWACSPDMSSGIGTLPSTCAGGTNNTPSQFNNNQSYWALTTFLRAYGFTFDKIDCTSSSQVWDASSKVQTIQNVLTELSTILWKDCGTCIDWKFWLHTQSKIWECAPTCTSPNNPVNPTDPACGNWYTHDKNIWCCVAPDCSAWEKMPLNNSRWCDDPNFTWDWAWCCIPVCVDPKKPANTPDCSDLQWYKYENWCCVSSALSNTAERENRCNKETPWAIASWTLNDATVSCINQEWTQPCCIDSWCWNQLTPWQTKPNLEFCPTPNPCSTWQVWTQSWASRACKTCEPWTAPNLARTKCICSSSGWNCCGIKLNTVVPFIWDCIEMNNDDSAPSAGNTTRVNALNAFPILMWSLSKILVTAILIFSFVMVVVWWVMIISWWIDESNFKKWKDIIYKVIMALALLWASWIILRLINPNFFG